MVEADSPINSSKLTQFGSRVEGDSAGIESLVGKARSSGILQAATTSRCDGADGRV